MTITKQKQIHRYREKKVVVIKREKGRRYRVTNYVQNNKRQEYMLEHRE